MGWKRGSLHRFRIWSQLIALSAQAKLVWQKPHVFGHRSRIIGSNLSSLQNDAILAQFAAWSAQVVVSVEVDAVAVDEVLPLGVQKPHVNGQRSFRILRYSVSLQNLIIWLQSLASSAHVPKMTSNLKISSWFALSYKWYLNLKTLQMSRNHMLTGNVLVVSARTLECYKD